jgi:dipicolinate synthase subunit B
MNWQGKTIGFALTGSHCTIEEILPQIRKFVNAGANVIPVVSQNVTQTQTRFGEPETWITQIKDITKNEIIDTIVKAEPFGPTQMLDVLIIAPCTGNTTSRLANAITDNAVLMAAKAQLRNLKPIVLAISTNDGLGLNSINIAKLLMMKHIFFVPFGQDAPLKKPNSLVAHMHLIMDSAAEALIGKQLQPILIQHDYTHI